MMLERLFTPWRAAYVTGAPTPSAGNCFLCANPRRNKDKETFILHRGRRGYILLNLYPYNSGHLMAAPYDHIGDLVRLDSETAQELWDLARLGVRALAEEYRAEGFNIGMNLGKAAGAGEPGHLHIHVVPRWSGDTNYMPVTAGAKVLPETLDQTYRRLKPRFPR